MKIGIIGSGSASTELPPHFHTEAARFPGAEVTLIQPRLSMFAFTPYERLLVDVGYVDAAQSAAQAHCDAILINSFADYGIEAARSAVEAPIMGAGEAALREASVTGEGRFCILTVWPKSMGFLYDERLRSLEIVPRCLAIRHFSAEDELSRLAGDTSVMARMARHEHDIIDALGTACEELIARHRPDSIVLGCTCISPIADALAKRCLVPVIDGAVSGLRLLASGNHIGSPVSARTMAKRASLIPDMVSAWIGTAHSPAPVATPDCPVCITDVE
jgi:Asp/Glu/hydantoin racemase